MPAFSHVRWSRWVGLCSLVLLAEGLSRGVDGLLTLVKDEAYLRGTDAVILLDRRAWADTRGHQGPATVAKAMLPRETATTRSRRHDGRRASRSRTAASSTPNRILRLHVGALRGQGGTRQRSGRPRRRSSLGARR